MDGGVIPCPQRSTWMSEDHVQNGGSWKTPFRRYRGWYEIVPSRVWYRYPLVDGRSRIAITCHTFVILSGSL